MTSPLPRLPQPRDDDPPATAEARDFATFFALLCLRGGAVGLIFIVGMVLPQALYLLAVIGVFGVYFVLHYLVWGRLMSRMLQDEAEQAETSRRTGTAAGSDGSGPESPP